MLRIGLCDDDKEYLQLLMHMVRLWADYSRVEVELLPFNNGDDLIARNAASHMDIVILDIVMPLLNGMDTARELRAQDTAVKLIFLTSSPEFALESYEVRAQDYLLKPVSYDRLQEALDACCQMLRAEPKNMVLKTSFGFQKLYFGDVEYAEAQNKRVVFHLRTGREVDTPEPLYSLEDKLVSEDGFFKCHRSYLVYLPNVDHFNSTEIIMRSGRCVPIARGYAKAFQEAYFAQMFREE